MLRRILVALALLLAVLPVTASAGAFTSWGPELGFSSGPNQIVVGGHLQVRDVAPELDFVPGLDLGFGDNQTLVSINGDFRYRFQVKSQWVPYVGAGLAVHFYSFDNPGPGVDNSDTKAGGHIIGGAQVLTKNKSTFFAELKLGLGDSPDFKAMAGWSFKI
jgi:hypothetical protein